MKKLFIFLLCSLPLAAQTFSVSGHVVDPSTAVPSNTTVIFTLVNTGTQQCKVSGTGLIVPATVTFTPNTSTGVITGTLYRNDFIVCGNQSNSQWSYQIRNGSTIMPACVLAQVATSSLNLDNTACSNTVPVVTPPTGDNTYCRLDGSNCGITGSISVTGAVTAGSYNGIPEADQAVGSDVGAKINAAIAAALTNGVVDARGFSSGTCTTNVNINKTVTLLVGPTLSGPCQITVSAQNVTIAGGSGNGNYGFSLSTSAGTIWKYTGTGNLFTCVVGSGGPTCTGLTVKDITFDGNNTAAHCFYSAQGASGSVNSIKMYNVHFQNCTKDGIHLEDNNYGIDFYGVTSSNNGGHGLLAGPNASGFSVGQFHCYGCVFDGNIGTDAGYGTIPASSKLAQVRFQNTAEVQLIGGTIADTPGTNANGIGIEFNVNGACPASSGPTGRVSGVHFEKLGIGASGAVDTANNAIYVNTCLGGLQIDNNNFVSAGGNVRNAIVTDANTSGANIFIGPNNSYGGYTKGYDGSLETASSSGSVWILDDAAKLAASAIVQNTGNLATFYWNGAQYIRQILRFSQLELDMEGAANIPLIRMATTNGAGKQKFIKNDGTLLSIQNDAQTINTTMDESGNWTFPALFTKYNAINTAGAGVPPIYGATLQKSETQAADANVLTFTPPAATGTYRVSVAISVSAATTGVISYTVSWTDSNGNAQSNIAGPLFQYGTAAPNTTFTTSAAGNYKGDMVIDVNNAAANIVVKWVGGGTTTAKMSATIERLQ